MDVSLKVGIGIKPVLTRPVTSSITVMSIGSSSNRNVFEY